MSDLKVHLCELFVVWIDGQNLISLTDEQWKTSTSYINPVASASYAIYVFKFLPVNKKANKIIV